MENSPRSLLDAETLPVWRRSPLHRPAGASFSLGRDMDLRLARITQANLLLIGREPELSTALASVMADSGGTVDIRPSAGTFGLPSAAGVRTIVLHDVDALTGHDQQRVLEWLTLAAGHTRIISTAARPLLPLVREQAFSAALYYRLNVLFFDLTS